MLLKQVNTLTREVMTEFSDIMGKAQSDAAVKSVVVISAKTDCFIAGADIQ